MSKTRQQVCVIICRNISPSLRYFLSLFLLEIAPLTFVGKLNRKTRDGLWDILSNFYTDYEITLAMPTSHNELGVDLWENTEIKEKYVQATEDGILLSVRRSRTESPHRKILGKTIPYDYPLIYHLLDTASVAEKIYELFLAPSSKRTIMSDFSFTGILNPEEKEKIILNFIRYVAGMHDIGKASPEWQIQTLKLDSTNEIFELFPYPKILSPGKEQAKHDINGGTFYDIDAHHHGHTKLFLNPPTKKAIREIITSHHGYKNEPNIFFELLDGWGNARERLEQDILDTLNIEANAFEQISSIKARALILVQGIVVLADWIASREGYITQVSDITSLSSHYSTSLEISEHFIQKNGLVKPEWKIDIDWSKKFPKTPQPNNFQAEAQKTIDKLTPGGLMLLTAPMGVGKTELSFNVGSQWGKELGSNGLWFGMPTQATSNAMFTRITSLGENIFKDSHHSVALLHSNSAIASSTENITRISVDEILRSSNMGDVVNDLEDNQYISDFLIEKKIGGASSLSVGTIDNILTSVVRLKHNMLLWLTLSGKVIVLDELHDYDIYTSTIIETFLEWCGFFNIPVIIMTATLSKTSQSKFLQAYLKGKLKSMPEVGKKKGQEYYQLLDQKIGAYGIGSPAGLVISPTLDITKFSTTPTPSPTYKINIKETDDLKTDIVTTAINHFNKQKYVLVVTNTVKDAISIYDQLSDQGYASSTTLLHSRMSPAMKDRIIENILVDCGKGSLRDSPKILVSTQIVEQSMDIDFDILITPLSPIENLLQRAGRIHRHNNPHRHDSRPEIEIYKHSDFSKATVEDIQKVSKKALPYSIWQLLLAEKILTTHLNHSAEGTIPLKEKIYEFFKTFEDINQTVKDQTLLMQEAYSVYTTKQNAWANLAETRAVKNSKIDNDHLATASLITAAYTKKSAEASEVRLIEDNIVLLPIRENQGEFYIIGEDDMGTEQLLRIPWIKTQKSLKILVKHSVTVPGWWKTKLEPNLLKMTDIESIPDYILPLYINKNGSDVAEYSVGKNGKGLMLNG